jgi:AcrR family transcriptional regulator
MDRKTAILDASAALVATAGFEGWSMDRVAAGAGCAKGLVVYHYRDRPTLLEATALRLLTDRHRLRLEALAAGAAPSALARLWWAVTEEVRSGRSAALFSLRAHGFPRTTSPEPRGLRGPVARALEIEEAILASDTAIEALLDGLALQLLARQPESVVREAYDQLWIAMIAPP